MTRRSFGSSVSVLSGGTPTSQAHSPAGYSPAFYHCTSPGRDSTLARRRSLDQAQLQQAQTQLQQTQSQTQGTRPSESPVPTSTLLFLPSGKTGALSANGGSAVLPPVASSSPTTPRSVATPTNAALTGMSGPAQSCLGPLGTSAPGLEHEEPAPRRKPSDHTQRRSQRRLPATALPSRERMEDVHLALQPPKQFLCVDMRCESPAEATPTDHSDGSSTGRDGDLDQPSDFGLPVAHGPSRPEGLRGAKSSTDDGAEGPDVHVVARSDVHMIVRRSSRGPSGTPSRTPDGSAAELEELRQRLKELQQENARLSAAAEDFATKAELVSRIDGVEAETLRERQRSQLLQEELDELRAAAPDTGLREGAGNTVDVALLSSEMGGRRETMSGEEEELRAELAIRNAQLLEATVARRTCADQAAKTAASLRGKLAELEAAISASRASSSSPDRGVCPSPRTGPCTCGRVDQAVSDNIGTAESCRPRVSSVGDAATVGMMKHPNACPKLLAVNRRRSASWSERSRRVWRDRDGWPSANDVMWRWDNAEALTERGDRKSVV